MSDHIEDGMAQIRKRNRRLVRDVANLDSDPELVLERALQDACDREVDLGLMFRPKGKALEGLGEVVLYEGQTPTLSAMKGGAVRFLASGNDYDAFSEAAKRIFGVNLSRLSREAAGSSDAVVRDRPLTTREGAHLLVTGVVTDRRAVGAGIVVDFTANPGTGRVGMAIGRFQPPHVGHVRLVERMLEENDAVILCIGSTQADVVGGPRHPFQWTERRDMLRALFSDKVKLVPLVDIDSLDSTDDWLQYVLGKIRKQKLPEPTDFYTGSLVDAKWYAAHFSGDGKLVTRSETDAHTYATADGTRRLHVVHDTGDMPVSATDIRMLIELRDPDWRQWIPEAIHDHVDRGYPGKLRAAIHADAFPENVPTGTAAVRTDMSPRWRYELDDDGNWKPVRKARTDD